MKRIAERVLGLVPSGVTYADVRVVRRRHEGIHVENEVVRQVLTEESEGIGLRVLLNGQWGFAATPRLDARGLHAAVRRAVDQARAADGLGPPITLAPAQARRARFVSPVDRDPFSVPFADKVQFLLEAARNMRHGAGASVNAEASMDFFQDEKLFASTEGACIEQTIVESGAGLMATASNGADVQRRSYPQGVPRAIRGQRGDFATAGYEHIDRLDLANAAPRVGEEAGARLSADPCPAITTTVIIGGAQMAQLIHETAGHPSELDRTTGAEASLSGGTYLEPTGRGRQRFGSDLVTIVADATLPGGLGSFGFDDDGGPPPRNVLVYHGTFVGYLCSRQSAATLRL